MDRSDDGDGHFGPYELKWEIGAGGMATVHAASLPGPGGFEKIVCIKRIRPEMTETEGFVDSFVNEAKLAAVITHPNVVQVSDLGVASGTYYIAMEYVAGVDVLTLLQAAGERGVLLPVVAATYVARELCEGLDAAHRQGDMSGRPLGIVHRDVSPQNVLVGLDGVGRIVDFGIALAASRIAASRPGVLKGKPSYMAPEQAQSESCDARADVFTLGIILWEILCGRRLFQAEMDVATLLQVMTAEIPPPSSEQPLCTEAMEAVAMKALERDLSARYGDARSLAAELEAAASAAGLIATTHEVADALSELFEERIAAKREAIRHHLSSSIGEPKPLEPGQLHLVPKLHDLSPSPRSGVTRETQSGVRDVDPHARTGVSTPPPAAETRPGRPSRLEEAAEKPALAAPSPAKSSPPRWLWIAVGVALLAMIGGWLALRPWAPTEVPAPRAAGDTPEPSPVVPEEPEAEPEGERSAVAELEAEAPEEEEEEEAAPTDPAPEAEPERPLEAEPERRPTPRVRRPRPPSEPAPSAPTGPTLETNPYMTR
ncbi:MAG TPA: hypothetical protein DEF51_26820 [Myxococcales bacterium]|nr:hypothetical protein [Myxococcales bacterium]